MTITSKRISSSKDLPMSAPADVFKARFDEFIEENNVDRTKFAFPNFSDSDTVLDLQHVGLRYGNGPYVLYENTMRLPKNKITAIIGPSGCGKSTYLRQLNRMNEEITKVHSEGKIIFEGKNILSQKYNVMKLRSKIGMVFQKPQPFPRSIYDNIAFGPRLLGIRNKEQLDEIVHSSLEQVGLANEVEGRLSDHAYGLSGGQQQRVCIARCVAVNPSVILFDEPTSALDPRSSYIIEDLMLELKKKYSIVIVTHNMQQAARLSDYSFLMYNGNIIEYKKTYSLFENPFFDLTENYIDGKFG